MKKFKTLVVCAFIICTATFNTTAQVYNWTKLNSCNHVGGLYTAINYGIIYGAHYGKIVKVKNTTLVPFIDLSLPTGGVVMDDYKIRLGTSALIFRNNNWMLTMNSAILNQKNSNPFVKMQSLGFETAIQYGYYKNKWFLNSNISYANALATHIKYSKTYLENYSSAVSGWYSYTSNNVFIGLNAGYSFNNIDFTLSPSIITTDNFKSTPTLPFSLKMGINYRF